jgi:hypothetical protein
MIWMGANPLLVQIEGVGPENRDFFGPLNGNERSKAWSSIFNPVLYPIGM